MTSTTTVLVVFFLLLLTQAAPARAMSVEITAAESGALKVLLVTSGQGQEEDAISDLLSEGLTDRIGRISFTRDILDASGKTSRLTRGQSTDWAAAFDLVVYNSCHLQSLPEQAIERIVEAHVEHTLPAVVLQCALQAPGEGSDAWVRFIGGAVTGREAERPVTVELHPEFHPIMVNFPRTWQVASESIYSVLDLSTGAASLARAYGQDYKRYHSVAWVHRIEGIPVFTSALGHNLQTMGHDVHLNLIASGLLWAAGKLSDDGTAIEGYSGERGHGWISLWDGVSLNNWRASENFESFQVEDGKIVVDGPRSHLFYEGPIAGGDFKNFEFKAQVYTYPQANSGIFFHTRYQHIGWPRRGYEAQVNATQRDRIKTGSLYGVLNILDDAPHEDNEWFDYYIQIDGRDIVFHIDGKQVLVYAEPSSREGTIRLSRGSIALQAHDPNSRIYFRELYIRVWPD